MNCGVDPFQKRAGDWSVAAFGVDSVENKVPTRVDRFDEESAELSQSLGQTMWRAMQIIKYVYHRPVGDPFQEVGGTMVTLATLCNAASSLHLDYELAAETELARAWKNIDAVRAKQALKREGSPLPLSGDWKRLVIIESPFAGKTEAERSRNKRYARAAVRDSLLRGEAPIASHLLYTQPGILDDDIPEERQHGIDAGLAWREVSDATVVYTNCGISRGMEYGIKAAKDSGIPVEHRTIDGDWRVEELTWIARERNKFLWTYMAAVFGSAWVGDHFPAYHLESIIVACLATVGIIAMFLMPWSKKV